MTHVRRIKTGKTIRGKRTKRGSEKVRQTQLKTTKENRKKTAQEVNRKMNREYVVQHRKQNNKRKPKTPESNVGKFTRNLNRTPNNDTSNKHRKVYDKIQNVVGFFLLAFRTSPNK